MEDERRSRTISRLEKNIADKDMYIARLERELAKDNEIIAAQNEIISVSNSKLDAIKKEKVRSKAVTGLKVLAGALALTVACMVGTFVERYRNNNRDSVVVPSLEATYTPEETATPTSELTNVINYNGCDGIHAEGEYCAFHSGDYLPSKYTHFIYNSCNDNHTEDCIKHHGGANYCLNGTLLNGLNGNWLQASIGYDEHGNLIGENGINGHPCDCNDPYKNHRYELEIENCDCYICKPYESDHVHDEDCGCTYKDVIRTKIIFLTSVHRYYFPHKVDRTSTPRPTATPRPTSRVTDNPTQPPRVPDEPTPTPRVPDEPTPTPRVPDEPTPTPRVPDEPTPTPDPTCTLQPYPTKPSSAYDDLEEIPNPYRPYNPLPPEPTHAGSNEKIVETPIGPAPGEYSGNFIEGDNSTITDAPPSYYNEYLNSIGYTYEEEEENSFTDIRSTGRVRMRRMTAGTTNLFTIS